MRRTLSFLLASALLLAGIALAGFEITHAEALRPFVLFGAVVIVVAAGYGCLTSSAGGSGDIDRGFFTSALVNIDE